MALRLQAHCRGGRGLLAWLYAWEAEMAAARAALVWAARDSCAALAAMASALPAASAACTDQPASQPPQC